MARIKLTKNELKTQKDNLKRFNRYLPTLVLKKQQLQMEIQKVEVQHDQKLREKERLEARVTEWVDVFGEDVGIGTLISLKSVNVEIGNVAGIDIPIYRGVNFEEAAYDLFAIPLWVDRAIEEIKSIFALVAELKILEEQIELLKYELRITSQRVNLFEKVKIPEARENIRVIRIFMGDQQTAAVVRGKISKNKLVRA
ncbi:MAG TPA: V-type ATP synthase subunit D [Spirochaetota bacterium]|nr:V-type ATP synthase subunit D [Spirochaetota bacterium]HNT12059.1 V-type ATP synthase subunit D [Spirochaetota bacterium]